MEEIKTEEKTLLENEQRKLAEQIKADEATVLPIVAGFTAGLELGLSRAAKRPA